MGTNALGDVNIANTIGNASADKDKIVDNVVEHPPDLLAGTNAHGSDNNAMSDGKPIAALDSEAILC